MSSETRDPVAGPGEVVVDVAVADVLFVDTPAWLGPRVLHDDAAVCAGLRSCRGGDLRWRGCGPWLGRPARCHHHARGRRLRRAGRSAGGGVDPGAGGLGLHEAAALLHDGTTAMALAEGAKIRSGEGVLVVAAAGGLGIVLVQLAHAAGARIIGAARGKRKLALARELGADVVVDYSEAGWPDRVREAIGGKGPDVVFDGVGGQIGRAAFEVTARGGRFSAHGAPSGAFAEIDPQEAERRGVTVRGIQHVQLAPADAKRLAERALSEAAGGRIRPVVGQTFPLERAVDAHAAIEGRGVLGKTLLLVGRQP